MKLLHVSCFNHPLTSPTLFVNTSRNKSQGTVVLFYRAIHAPRLVQMPSKKKKRSCPFSSATAKRKKPKKLLSSDQTENLAESNKGLLLRPRAMAEGVYEQPSAECDLSVSTSTFSAAGERLQEKIIESVTCLFCHGNVELMENLRTWLHFNIPVKAVHRTKLILHFRRRKEARRSR